MSVRLQGRASQVGETKEAFIEAIEVAASKLDADATAKKLRVVWDTAGVEMDRQSIFTNGGSLITRHTIVIIEALCVEEPVDA